MIRESGGDRSAVTGGTKVLSDRIVVRITQKPGESFIDRMIALVEGANRQKTPERDRAEHPARRADDHLPAGGGHPAAAGDLRQGVAGGRAGHRRRSTGDGVTGIVLVSLLVCLIPTTIGALLSAIGIAGMDRLVQRNVLAMSGRAVEAAGDVNTLLLDKTGTITLGNRQAAEFLPVDGVDRARARRRRAAVQPGRRDPEGRSIVVLAKSEYGLRERDAGRAAARRRSCRSPRRPGCPASTSPRTATGGSARARPRR